MTQPRAWDPTAPGGTAQSDSAETSAQGRQGVTAQPVTGNESRYRAEFPSGTTHPDFDVVLGTGMSIANPGGATAHWDISTGTTINQTTTITCKKSFSVPHNVAFGFKLSQKIANQEFYFELVAENPDGTVDNNTVASWRVAFADAAGATNARFESRNAGPTVFQSVNQTVNSEITDSIFEITIETDEIWFHSKPLNTSSARTLSVANQFIVPDPNRRYRPRIRINNLGTAPGSNTVVSFYYLSVSDYTEIKAEMTGSSGNGAGGASLPVNVVQNSVTGLEARIGAAGTLISKVNSAATTNAANIKATAARLYGFNLGNNSAAWRYVHLHNKATAPTVGTDSPALIIAIPPGGHVTEAFPLPITFATGLGISITTGAADLDATATGANEVVGAIHYF